MKNNKYKPDLTHNISLKTITACLTTEYPCVDGFCLGIGEGLGNNKPDCIDARYTPELKYKMDEQVLEIFGVNYAARRKIPGIPGNSGNAKNDCAGYGFVVAGDYRYQCMGKYVNFTILMGSNLNITIFVSL